MRIFARLTHHRFAIPAGISLGKCLKRAAILLPVLFLALAAVACRYPGMRSTAPGEDTAPLQEGTAMRTVIPSRGAGSVTEESPEEGPTGSPSTAETAAGGAATGLPAGKPPQSQRAEIRPAEMRLSLTRGSALMGMQVLDRDGALLGTAADWVVNTCETYLIYFLLDPSEGLNAPAGDQIVVPYEVVTINSGILDTQSQSIQLQISASQLKGAPALPKSQALIPTDLEAGVREFWSQRVRISGLTTGCRVPASGGGTVETHKVARASKLLETELKDGLGNGLGRVEEMIVEPESGKLSFFVIRRTSDSALVLVPLRVVNIPKEALEPGGQLSLVLLVDSGLLLGAPQIGTIEAAVQPEAQATARGYWGR